jgi:sigma-B regulation protein RsbU (phosphoserine phosphatase)
MIRAALHAHRALHSDPAAVLRTLNEHFDYLWDTEMFATAIYATLDAGRRELRIACAGHPPPLLVRGRAEVRPLAVDAVPPLLMMPLDSIPAPSIQLEPGDRVLFYTDGVTERMDRQGRMYDLPRLCAVLTEAAALPPAALIRHVVDDLERFADGHEPDDDLTLVAIGIG